MSNTLSFAGLVALGYLAYDISGLVGVAILVLALLAGHITEALLYAWKTDEKDDVL